MPFFTGKQSRHIRRGSSSRGIQPSSSSRTRSANEPRQSLQVTVTQTFRNTLTNPLETVYVYPVEDGSAVFAFSAEVDGRHIRAEVKPKQEVHTARSMDLRALVDGLSRLAKPTKTPSAQGMVRISWNSSPATCSKLTSVRMLAHDVNTKACSRRPQLV